MATQRDLVRDYLEERYDGSSILVIANVSVVEALSGFNNWLIDKGLLDLSKVTYK